MDEVSTKIDVAGETNNPAPAIVKHESQLTESSINYVNLLDPDQYAAAEVFLTKVMRSKKGGIESVADGMAVLMRAQDLKLPFSSSLEHIHVINGKTGVDIHIIKALLLKAGVTWDCLKDYTPLYEYTDGINVYNESQLPTYAKKCISRKVAEEKIKEEPDSECIYVYPVKFYKDFTGNLYREYQLNGRFQQVTNKVQADEVAKAGKIPVFRVAAPPIDYVCEYKFYRKVGGRDMTVISKFSYNDAVAAGFFEKDTYAKYARIMIGHRAFTYGARDIASDVIMGCYETTELKIMNGLDIDDQDIQDVNPIKVN